MPSGVEVLPSPLATLPLRVYLLGVVPFDDVQRLQRRFAYEVGEQEAGVVVLCEHPETISVGRQGSWAHIAADPAELRRRGVAVRWINRGGGCVLHQPGQLIAQVILPLRPLGIGIAEHVARLQAATIATLSEFDLKATTRPDCDGIFLDTARVANVGVAWSRSVAYHGLTLNVGNDWERWRPIVEPGPNGRPLAYTSIEARRARPAPMAWVRSALLRHLEQTFGLEQQAVFTGHPQLAREALRHAFALRRR